MNISKIKKSVIALSFIAISALTFSASAQTESTEKQNCPSVCTQESCQPAKECRKARPENCKKERCLRDENRIKAGKKEMKMKTKASVDLFEGIELTADQKAKIEELNARRRAEAEAFRSEMKSQKKAMKEQRGEMKKSGKLTDEQKAEMKAKRAEQMKQRIDRRESCRRDYLDNMKSILTPEQYNRFLENSFMNGKAGGDKASVRGHRHGNRSDKHATHTGGKRNFRRA